MTRDVAAGGRSTARQLRAQHRERTDYPHFEIVYVDNGDCARTPRGARVARGLALRAVTFTGPFNVADKMNLGARHAAGEQPALPQRRRRGDRPGGCGRCSSTPAARVGAVGAKLYFPTDAVQHAGVIMPAGRLAGARLPRLPAERQAGIADLGVVRNYSAVTAACLMTRADGVRRRRRLRRPFPVNYNDVDYCLKVRERGLRGVHAYAELYHFESLSRVGSADTGSGPRSWRGSPGDGARREAGTRTTTCGGRRCAGA
jgi:hypothetical protein